MSFPINTLIPNPPNDPADDCPLIKQNFANIDGYLKVDHVAAGSTGNGFHKQTTFNSLNPAGAQTDPLSVEYTNVGIADATANRPQLYWRNSQVIVPLSAVRAFCSFVWAPLLPAPLVFLDSFNIKAASSSTGAFTSTIELNANVVFGNNVVIFIQNSDGSASSYTFANPVLTIFSNNLAKTVNILVLQI